MSSGVVMQSIRNRPKTILALTGLALSIGYRRQKAEEKRLEDAKKKKVLVLPFHRMKIVEERSPTSTILTEFTSSRGGSSGGGDDSKTIEMPVDEVVTLIHEAAQDPGITGLYGVFGHGGSITGGWAHLEEIRTALLVFASSHRQHKEPAINGSTRDKATTPTPTPSSSKGQHNKESTTDSTTKPTENGGQYRKRKFMYVYADTFASPTSSMKDFYVASVFSKIHLQENGDLNLFGLHATNTFFKDFLQKYGINVHVWKHGEYKNAANSFTHNRYTRDHFENVAGILLPMHQYICNSIYSSRFKDLKKYGASKDDGAEFWDMVTRAGSLPSKVAHQIGFIDFMSRMDPLDVLLEQNKKKSDKPKSTTDDKTAADTEEATSPTKDADEDTTTTTPLDSWKYETDFDHFSADSKISISEYARQRKLERSKESKMWAEYRQISESTGMMRSVYALLGYKAPYYNVSKDKYSASNVMGVKEKIAVIKINGAITETTARKAEKALRSVKNQKDVKCVVLRVDSPGGSINACETIYQRIQDLPQKVVVSFGNVSASGGYYISANAERIFASPTTITGSIGVFMLRVDIRGLAMRYGITFDSIPTSPLSGSFDPCFPINTTMEDNFAISSDRAYHRFKSLVSNGRGMDMDAVEAVAKGRVWTGEQAKEVGLVDELGGLQRAVAYAQRECTSTGHAEVVQWPPKKSIWQMLMQQDLNDMELPEVWKALLSELVPQSNFFGRRSSPENFLSSDCEIFSSLSSALPVTNGVMLTADENTAIRIALEENGIDLPLSSTAVPGGVWKL